MKFVIITVAAFVLIALSGCTLPVAPIMFLVDDAQSMTCVSSSVSDV